MRLRVSPVDAKAAATLLRYSRLVLLREIRADKVRGSARVSPALQLRVCVCAYTRTRAPAEKYREMEASSAIGRKGEIMYVSVSSAVAAARRVFICERESRGFFFGIALLFFARCAPVPDCARVDSRKMP